MSTAPTNSPELNSGELLAMENSPSVSASQFPAAGQKPFTTMPGAMEDLPSASVNQFPVAGQQNAPSVSASQFPAVGQQLFTTMPGAMEDSPSASVNQFSITGQQPFTTMPGEMEDSPSASVNQFPVAGQQPFTIMPAPMEDSPSVPASQFPAAGQQAFSITLDGRGKAKNPRPTELHSARQSNLNYSEFTQTQVPYDSNTDDDESPVGANADKDEDMEVNGEFMEEDYDDYDNYPNEEAPPPTQQQDNAGHPHAYQGTSREELPVRKRVIVESKASSSLLRVHNAQLRGQLVKTSENHDVMMRRRAKAHRQTLEEQTREYNRARQVMLEEQAKELDRARQTFAEQAHEMLEDQANEHNRLKELMDKRQEERLEVYGRTLREGYEQKLIDMEHAHTREWESRQEQWKSRFEEYEKQMADKMEKLKATKEDEIAAASYRARYQRQRTPSSPTPVAMGSRPSRRSASIGVHLQVVNEKNSNENGDDDMQTGDDDMQTPPNPQTQRPAQAPNAGSSLPTSSPSIPPQRPAQTPNAGPSPSPPLPAQATGAARSPPLNSSHASPNPPNLNSPEGSSHWEIILEKLSELGGKIERIETSQSSTPERQRGANAIRKRYGRSPVMKTVHHTKYLEVVRKWYKEQYNLGDDNDISSVESVKEEIINAYMSGNANAGLNDDYLPLDFVGNEKSIWNKRVFALILKQVKVLVKDAELPDAEDTYLMCLIQNKYSRLRQKWREAMPRTDINGNKETMEEVDSRLESQSQKHHQQARRHRRRTNKYDRRVKVVQQILQVKTRGGSDDVAVWEWLGNMLDWLGQEGTSSDESEEGAIEVLFRVKLVPWRRPMDKYLDLIDGMRVTEPIFPPQGSKPQRRIRGGGLQSCRNAVEGLPKCLYDEPWLKRNATVSVSKEAFEWLTLMIPV